MSVVESPTHPCGVHESAGAALPPLGPIPKGGTRPASGKGCIGTGSQEQRASVHFPAVSMAAARRSRWITVIPLASSHGQTAGVGHREAAAAQGTQLPAGSSLHSGWGTRRAWGPGRAWSADRIWLGRDWAEL